MMNDVVLKIWIRLNETPLFLRFATCISPFGAIMVLLCVFPLSTYRLNGRQVSYAEFWASGAALVGIAVGCLITAIGVGIFNRRKWARSLIIAFILTQDFFAFKAIYTARQNEILGVLIFLVLLNGFSVWYLFFKKSVKYYFGTASDIQPSGGAV